MPRETKVRGWTPSIFVSDVAFADIAGQDEDFLRLTKRS